VLHRLHDGPAVTAPHIPDHTVDVEQQNGPGRQGGGNSGW
jgi:hypothetical protein